MEYEKFCEQLFQDWLDGRLFSEKAKDNLSDFKNDKVFAEDLDYVPEPYYVLKEGNNPLYVLNYNPGGSQGYQERSYIRSNKHDSYRTVADQLANQYRSEEFRGTARGRNRSILEFASEMGYDGVWCVETFFLHSRNWNDKDRFVRNHQNNPRIKEYNRLLKEFLKDKPVLRIAASGHLDRPSTFRRLWVNYQNDIMGVDLNAMRLIKTSQTKNGISSGIFVGKVGTHEKFISMFQGNNLLPKLTPEHFAQLRIALERK